MYRYLDRRTTDLAPSDAFLVTAMRLWVTAASAGQCPCAALRLPFAARNAGHALQDFGMAMAALNIDGLRTLRFGEPQCCQVSDDEAVLLALFDAGRARDPAAPFARAAALVSEDAVTCLSRAIQRVAAALPCSPFGETR